MSASRCRPPVLLETAQRHPARPFVTRHDWRTEQDVDVGATWWDHLSPCDTSHMTSVGVRELRQQASELLRRVERAASNIEPASETADDFPAPLSLPVKVELPSMVLAWLRRNAR